MSDEALLKEYFKFDEADLFANRSGTLTEKQRKRLADNALFSKKVFLIAGCVLFAIAIVPSIVLFFVKAPAFFLIIWSLIWIPVWSFIGIKVIRMGRPDKKDFELKSVEGRVNIVKDENYNLNTKRNDVDYELHIGGVTFDVEPDLADIMMQGDSYAVYYIQGTKDILSAEKV